MKKVSKITLQTTLERKLRKINQSFVEKKIEISSPTVSNWWLNTTAENKTIIVIEKMRKLITWLSLKTKTSENELVFALKNLEDVLENWLKMYSGQQAYG